VEARLKNSVEEFESIRKAARDAKLHFESVKEKRFALFSECFQHISKQIDLIYKELTSGNLSIGGTAYLSLENQEEPYLEGIKYHAMPPLKRFREMEQLSGGEKTIAAMALLFAVHR
jgi:structural maintenance of chromosome 1